MEYPKRNKKLEKTFISYIADLCWQEQDEVIRKINKVLVNNIF